jgi:hypothetical protein
MQADCRDSEGRPLEVALALRAQADIELLASPSRYISLELFDLATFDSSQAYGFPQE